MADAIAVVRDGYRSFFKWHRGRRRASDPVFTGARIIEAMRLGASVEVDLVVTGDHGFAVLHDLTLERETTGRGAVAQTRDAIIRQLNLRGNDGVPIPDHVMLLDDLCKLMAAGPLHEDGLLQLDYKQDAAALDARALERFARSVTPLADHIIVSSGDAAAVELLRQSVPGMRVGFDPSDEGRVKAARVSGDYAGFVRDALAACPQAAMIYLYWEIILGFADDGFDLIGAFHAEGRRVDAWTIQRVDAATLAAVERLLALKVDQITTDDPEGLAAAL